jgi:hypothetical protein
MTVIKHENGLELIPDNEFERDCLKHIVGKRLTAEWISSWETTPNVKIEFPKDEWGR